MRVKAFASLDLVACSIIARGQDFSGQGVDRRGRACHSSLMRKPTRLPDMRYNNRLLIVGLVAICGLVYGQNAPSNLAFEVASVKSAAPPDGRGRFVRATGVPGSAYGKDPGRFTAENFSLTNLITMAYDIPYYRLSGIDGLNKMFNIEAKMPVDTTAQQFRIMLQNLLAERFGLKVHWVTRRLDIYELGVAKGGPKLKEATADSRSRVDDSSVRRPEPGPPKRGPDGYPIPPPGNERWMAIAGGKAIMRGHNETGTEMASMFSTQVGSPVTDATGLTGKYDYTIYWSTSATRGMTAAPPSPDGASPALEPDGPSLFDALREQLGLKLESTKGPVQVLAVDHVETKPTEN